MSSDTTRESASAGLPFIHLIPTPEEISGDLSGLPQIYNPYTTRTDANGQLIRDPFPGNRIPPTAKQCGSHHGQAALSSPQLAPGVIPGRNYINTAPATQDGT